MKCCGSARANMRRDDNLNILTQGHQEPHQPLNGKLPKIAAQHLGNIWLLHPKKAGRFGLFEATLTHQAVNPDNELSFDKMFLGIGQTNVGKHIAAALFEIDR